MKFSAVVPVYHCEPFIRELCQRLDGALSSLTDDFEIIFVNDASPMADWELIMELSSADNRIKGINFSRNFGQHYAITAGLQYASGDFIVVMDGDLQDQPEEISKLYAGIVNGYDIVLAQRTFRKDGFIKQFSSKMFYKVFGYLTNSRLDAKVANYGIYSRRAIDAFLAMGDEVRYFPTMIQWVGFKNKYIEVEHASRGVGTSSYSYKRLFILAKNNIIAFSDKPLHLTIRLGFFMSFVSFIVGILFLLKYFQGQITEVGYTSLIISIWFLSGIIIAILGMLGIYLGKMFDKLKDRPHYIISDTLNF